MTFKLVLHIGRHKSGTSALQLALHQNRAFLESHGLLYPSAGSNGKAAHHDLAYALNPKLKRNDYTQVIQSIGNEIKDSHHTVILSSEAFQNIQVVDRVRILVDSLKPNQTEIVCYFREYVDYCIASYSQRVQAQPTFVPFQKLVNDMRGLSVNKFIERWSSIGDFKMYWFDRSKLINLDIVDDFFSQIGFASLLEKLNKYPSNPNPSIGGNLLFLKNAANFVGQDFISYQSMSKLAATFATFRTPMYLPLDLADHLRKESDYNQYLIARLGPIALKDWSSNPPIPNHNSIQSDIEKIELFTPSVNKKLLSELACLATEQNDWFKLTKPELKLLD
jgi:hypothetical protein